MRPMLMISRGVVPVALCSLGLAMGCASDMTGTTSADSAHLYWQLALNHHAITLALTPPYDTITLKATPLTPSGALLTDTGTTTYVIVNGDTNVTVSPGGILMAYLPSGAGNFSIIYARRTIGGVTKIDSTFVVVNDVAPVPVLAKLILQPAPGTSLQGDVVSFVHPPPQLLARAVNTDGDTIQNVMFLPSAPDAESDFLGDCGSAALSFYDGCVLDDQRVAKRVWVHVETTVYGVSKTDSVLVTYTAPLLRQVGMLSKIPAGSTTPIGYFSPHDDTVGVGGFVSWRNLSVGIPADVVFDTPAAAAALTSADSAYLTNRFDGFAIFPSDGGGNIARWSNGLDTLSMNADGTPNTVQIRRIRRFPTVGDYPYHSAIYGTTGVIHVVN